jgi:type IV pilus assembly protein PilE
MQNQRLPSTTSHAPDVRQHGFTLIEVMIVVAIIAILAGIAVPSYADYVLRGHIAEATSGLNAMRARMEQHYQDNRSYLTGPCLTADTRSAKTFTIQCAQPTGTAYRVTATGSGVTNGFVFQIDQSGQERTTGLPPRWGTVPSAGFYNCWVTKRGDTC